MPNSESLPSPPKSRTPRMVAWLGWGGLAAWFIVLGVLSVMDPRPYAGVWLVVAQQLVGGRALGIATALSLGMPKGFVVLHCTLMDMLIIMCMYPLLIAGMRKAFRLKFVGRMVENAHAQAVRYKDRLQRFGPPGLSMFVMLPLWSTGPMAGTVVGHLMEMRVWVALAAVTVGNAAAITGWTFLFGYIQGFSGTYGKWLPVGILVLIVVWFAVGWARKRSKRAKDAEVAEVPEGDAEPEAVGSTD